ncbi:hypothetical protein C0J45_18388 [Silurus meridionalis]|nr:hypothetical protein C0J45_18388 [Silurus meridionalis]
MPDAGDRIVGFRMKIQRSDGGCGHSASSEEKSKRKLEVKVEVEMPGAGAGADAARRHRADDGEFQLLTLRFNSAPEPNSMGCQIG